MAHAEVIVHNDNGYLLVISLECEPASYLENRLIDGIDKKIYNEVFDKLEEHLGDDYDDSVDDLVFDILGDSLVEPALDGKFGSGMVRSMEELLNLWINYQVPGYPGSYLVKSIFDMEQMGIEDEEIDDIVSSTIGGIDETWNYTLKDVVDDLQSAFDDAFKGGDSRRWPSVRLDEEAIHYGDIERYIKSIAEELVELVMKKL